MGLNSGHATQIASPSRRAFLRGRVSQPVVPAMRPPWALDEAQFLRTCTGCDACIKACDEGILRRADGGYPEVDFHQGECTFCGDCREVCEPQALRAPDNPSDAPWDVKAQIDNSCLSKNAVTCRVCGDRCDARAIRFQLALGGVADPIIDYSACTGCGACVAPCPVGAVDVVHHHAEEVSP